MLDNGNQLILVFIHPHSLISFFFLNNQIGLAVGDIASMQRNAQLKRLAMQVELHTDLEQKLPNSILKAGDKERYTVQSNCAKFYLVQVSRLLSLSQGTSAISGYHDTEIA